jgi:hypothetical protein
MDIGAILIILGVIVLAGVFVARPLLERQPLEEPAQSRQLSGIQAELDRVLATIQELDMDSAMGKLTDEDYQAQRQSWVSRGAALIKERDQMAGVGAGSAVGAGGALDARIEAEVAMLRRDRAVAPAGYCPQCGQPAQSGDRFCVHCGASLVLEEKPA